MAVGDRLGEQLLVERAARAGDEKSNCPTSKRLVGELEYSYVYGSPLASFASAPAAAASSKRGW